MIGCLTETTTCVVAKPLVYIKLLESFPIFTILWLNQWFKGLIFLLLPIQIIDDSIERFSPNSFFKTISD